MGPPTRSVARRSSPGLFRWTPLLLAVVLLAAPAEAQQVQLLSKRAGTASDTGGGASGVVVSSLSTDGRYLVFTSGARNLAPGQVDSNFTFNDVFLYDRVTGAVTLVSHAAGAPATTANGSSDAPVISADGAWVAFRSGATNLVPGQVDSNFATDVFLYERATGALSLVSRAAGTIATTGNGASGPPTISADGGIVAFPSSATNLVVGQIDANGAGDAFVFDRAAGVVDLASRAAGTTTTTGNGGVTVTNAVAVSADGAFVGFSSGATNHVVGQLDTNGTNDVFLFDRVAGTVALVSRAAGTTTTTANQDSGSPWLSGDGSFVAFLSNGTNVVAGQVDTNGGIDVFLFDRTAGTVSLVSRAAGTIATTGSAGTVGQPQISRNGLFVAFAGNANNHVVGQVDTNATQDIFLFDRLAGSLTLVSHVAGSAVTTGAFLSENPSISDDGAYVAFVSISSNLAAGQVDSNGLRDAFVFERGTGTTTLVSRVAGTTATAATTTSSPVVVSGNGGFVAFQSNGTNLVLGAVDLNGATDVFLFDRVGGTNALTSRRDPGLPSATPNGTSFTRPYASSTDGRYTVFVSDAPNLIAGQSEGNSGIDVFLADRVAGAVTLVSHAAGSTTLTGNAACTFDSAISADGAWVAFACSATNLVPGQVDANGANDVFLFERATGAVTLVSHTAASALTAGTGTAITPRMSGDGRYVVFESTSTNHVTGQADTNGATDLFVFDRLGGAISLVSRKAGTLATTGAGSSANAPVISADGAYIVFRSAQTDLVAGQVDGAGSTDVFLFERATGAMTLVSHAAGAGATTANGASVEPAISLDGAFVAFSSLGTNLVAGQSDVNSGNDVFLFDRTTGTVQLVSRSAGSATTAGNGASSLPALSDDGRLVVFKSSATNLFTGQADANGNTDVFLFDAVAGTTVLASHVPGSTSTTGNNFSDEPTISGSGTTVAFRSQALNLVPGQVDTNGADDVFVLDPATGLVTLASHAFGTTTTTGSSTSNFVVLSNDGNYLAFTSTATNLVASDFDGSNDVYLFGPMTPTADLVVAKDDGLTTAVPGTSVTYSIVVTNLGPWAATGATVTDVLPSSLTGAVWTCTASPGSSCTATGSGDIVDAVNLPVGGTVTYTLATTVDPAARGFLNNTATVTPPGGVTDPVPGNNSALDQDTLSPSADLSLSMTGPGAVVVGDTLTYALTVANQGPSEATGIVLTNTLPGGMEFQSSTPGAPTCNFSLATRKLTCALPALSSPAVATITIDARAVSVGTFKNTAKVQRTESDPDPLDDDASLDTVVSLPGDAVAFLTVTSSSTQNVLEWLNPAIGAAYVRTKILVKSVTGSSACSFASGATDASATDLGVPAGAAGAKGSFVHAPLPNDNTTYCYAAFVEKAPGGVYSSGRYTKGRPFGPPVDTNPAVRWAYSTGAAALAPPGMGVTAVHAVSNDNALHAMDKATGLWPTSPGIWKPAPMAGPSQGRPSAVPVRVQFADRVNYIGSQDGSVYAVDADTGTEVWRSSLEAAWLPGTQVQAAPSGIFAAYAPLFGTSFAYSYILVGTRYAAGDNAFFALNMDDGSVAWSFSDGGSEGKFGPVNFQASVEYKAPSAPEHRVYFTSFALGIAPNNTVWCLDLDTGGVAWAAPVTSVSTSPTLDTSLRRIYVGTFDGVSAQVQALNADDGSVVWSQPTGDGLVKGFVMVDRLTGDLYFSTTTKVHAWTAGGAPKWAAPRADIADPSVPVPVPGSGRVYLGGGDGMLHMLKAGDGSDDVAPITLGDGLAAVGSPTLDLRGGRIYVGSEAGVIYAIDTP